MINLPYIVDGEEVITQSNSCMLYLGHQLGIDTPGNFIKNHQALDQVCSHFLAIGEEGKG